MDLGPKLWCIDLGLKGGFYILALGPWGPVFLGPWAGRVHVLHV